MVPGMGEVMAPPSYLCVFVVGFLCVVHSTFPTDSSPMELCRSPGCVKSAPYRCKRCRDVWYCSRECQKTHWREHKRYCDAHLKINVASIDEEDLIYEVLPVGTRLCYYGGRREDEFFTITKFNLGKGPYRDPMVRG